jgi:plastocyanin
MSLWVGRRPLPYGVVLLAGVWVLAGWPAQASELSGRITIQSRASRRPIAPLIYDLRGSSADSPAPAGSVFDRVGVWLESNVAFEHPSAGTLIARMQQRNRRFDPELLIVPVGASVEFPNSDPIFHNIFSLSPAQKFDLGYYPEGHSRSVTFPRAGIVQVYCHVHPSMNAVIIVTPSPWTSQPGKDGRFGWTGVPPGRYRLMVWNRGTGLIHKKVLVPPEGTVEVDVAIPEQDADQ